jgi:hypothetical protein
MMQRCSSPSPGEELRPCPECGESVTQRRTEVGYSLRLPAYLIRRGPEHSRRCPHWRREP